MKLQNKKVLITGGASGIGKAIAQKFLEEGAQVTIFDIVEPDYEVSFKKVDITKENEISDAMSELEGLDILINNAGIYFQSWIEETTKDDLDKIVDINFKGPYLVTKHAIGLLKKQKGIILNIASCLAIAPEPEAVAYCATKAAVVMLTKCLSQSYSRYNVRVNAILPGPTDTPLLQTYFKNEEDYKRYQEKKPMGRIAQPNDIANVALFLASEGSAFINGGLYSVDGGESVSSIYSK